LIHFYKRYELQKDPNRRISQEQIYQLE